MKCKYCEKSINFLTSLSNKGCCESCFQAKLDLADYGFHEANNGGVRIEYPNFFPHNAKLLSKTELSKLDGVTFPKHLYDAFIKSISCEKKDVCDIANLFYYTWSKAVEKDKLKLRSEKRKLREEVEKEFFGKVKSIRANLTTEEKNSIFEKFNNKCATCGKTEGLHIHHKDGNPSNNKIDNLIVLCGICHKKIHMTVR